MTADPDSLWQSGNIPLVIAAGYFLLYALTKHSDAVPFAVLRRWTGLLAGSIIGGWILHRIAILDRGIVVTTVLAGLLLFLLETLYQWMLVKALSRSEWPLFPRYEPVENGGWPSHRAGMRVKNRLEAMGYRTKAVLESKVLPELSLCLVALDDEAGTSRVHLHFLPRGRREPRCFASFLSLDDSGRRLITDNFAVPFGGFYPASWLVERHPWRQSIAFLSRRHRHRLARESFVPVANTGDPEEEINAMQQQLEATNRECGFLRYRIDEAGDRISSEGRYRIWLEIFLVGYLGRTFHG